MAGESQLAEQGVDTGPVWDPFSEALIPNPFHAYDVLRAENPVYWDSMLQGWVLTRYEDVRQVLLDDSFKTKNLSELFRLVGTKLRKDYSALCKVVEAILFLQNGDEHRRNRRTLTRVMANMPLGKLEPAIREFATALRTDLDRRREFDAIDNFATRVPAFVMMRVLGLRESDASLLTRLGGDFARALDVIPASLMDKLNSNATAIFDQFSSRIAEAVADGEETGLSIIYEGAQGEGDAKLIDAVALTSFFFAVGTETTSSLIGSCVRTLLAFPDLYARLRANPSLAERFVAEVNRLESAVQRSFRLAGKDCTVGGQQIRRDDRMFLMLGAANRDPEKFSRPNDIDLARGESGDLAFGAGQHFCLGVNLARTEAKIAMEQFLQMRPVEPVELPVWFLGRTVRRVRSFPVRFAEG